MAVIRSSWYAIVGHKENKWANGKGAPLYVLNQADTWVCPYGRDRAIRWGRLYDWLLILRRNLIAFSQVVAPPPVFDDNWFLSVAAYRAKVSRAGHIAPPPVGRAK